MAQLLVTGAHGTLGHVVCEVLSLRHDVIGVSRRPLAAYASPPWMKPPRLTLIDDLDLTDGEAMARRLPASGVSVVVNCAGLIKQKPAAKDPMAVLQANSVMPRRLAQWCDARGAHLIHISTDCVFSGRRGGYCEADTPDPDESYGMSKMLGEIPASPHLTLRTSFIGPQLAGTEGLFAWFLAQQVAIKGFSRAVFSGFTTLALARIIERIIDAPTPLSGLYHLASQPISKYDLLCAIEQRLGRGLTIERDESFVCDRSLDGRRFADATGIASPSWDEMLDELCQPIAARTEQRPARRAGRRR